MDTDAAADTDAADTDAADDTDVGSSFPTGTVRFVALGDAGEGNPDQYTNADAVKAICDVRGCDFALYLGDNFYDEGVTSVDDSQFLTKFEDPYEDLDFPFYVVLGNHDFGEIPIDFLRTSHQVDYSSFSDKWTMPDHFYTFDKQHTTFIGLDTNSIMLNASWDQPQRPWVNGVMASSQTQGWRIAFGHHPWRSNGRHGNAGNYEGLGLVPLTELANGHYMKLFLRGAFCQKLDIYISGHDHNRQWLDPACGVHIFVSGAGAKTTDFEHRDNNGTVFEDDEIEGFIWFELVDNVATIAFYDMHGNLQHEGTIVK